MNIKKYCTPGEGTTDEIRVKLITAGYSYHHLARARGYVRSKKPYIEAYSGKFGKGYILHSPNNESAKKSNEYHDIMYFVENA